MSRYNIPARTPQYSVAVGWDNPMQTFFALVSDLNEMIEDESYIVWLGGTPGEVTNIEKVEEAIQPYADLPPDVKNNMLRDYEARTEPTPLQRLGARLFREAVNEDQRD